MGVSETGKLYRVQVGAFAKRENAEAMVRRLELRGL
ncbi:SPOR domain-containing protein [Evansella sp. AB-rgal1]